MPDDSQKLQTNPVEGDETLWGYLALLEDPDYDYYINNQDVSPKDKAKLLEIFLNGRNTIAIYESVNQFKEHNKYLRGLVMWTGYPSIGVPFDRAERFAGTPKSDFRTVLKVATNGILSFSYVPLRLVSTLGVIMTALSFILGLFYLYLFITEGRTAPGITTVILLTLILFGILFFVLGIISEYLARIYEEVKQRPRYIVKSTQGLKI